MVIYMSEQNPDWSDTMEGHVVNFIVHTVDLSCTELLSLLTIHKESAIVALSHTLIASGARATPFAEKFDKCAYIVF